MTELENTLQDILVGRCLIALAKYYPGQKLRGEKLADAIDDIYENVATEVSNDDMLAMNLNVTTDEVGEAAWMLEDNVKFKVAKRTNINRQA